jgi:hypothetical protein
MLLALAYDESTDSLTTQHYVSALERGSLAVGDEPHADA